MNTTALLIYLFAGALLALFNWFEWSNERTPPPLPERLAWCAALLFAWPVFGVFAVGMAYDGKTGA